jgi:hypothetical protein
MTAEQTLKVLKNASIHLRATHGRSGMVVRLTEADEVLVAGDLHGNLANFRKILKLAALDENPRRHLVLQEFVHGTGRYPDGGCTSHQLLDAVAALKCQYPQRVHLLPGNHEMAEWTGRAIAKSGVAMNELFAQGVAHAFQDAAAEVFDAYLELIGAMPLAVRTENRIFISHSIPPAAVLDQFDRSLFDRWGVPEDQRGKNSSLYHLLWGRDVSEEAAKAFCSLVDADLLVTGHIASEEGYRVPNSRQIILDCVGAPAGCVLFPTVEPLTHPRLVACLKLL